jgi:uncharacterized protein YjbI with pentapeptide repeats
VPDVVKLNPPRVPAVLDAAPRRVEPEGRYANVHVRGASLAHADTSDIEIVASRLEAVNLGFAEASHVVVRDCVFERGDLANLNARASALTRVSFDGVRMTGAQLVDCVFTDVTFTEVKLDMAALRFTKCRRVTFRGCNMTRTDFTNADIRGARFIDCDLSGAQFSNAQADGAALENCWLEGIGGVAHLRGASVRSNDLVSLSRVLAQALGIQIVG